VRNSAILQTKSGTLYCQHCKGYYLSSIVVVSVSRRIPMTDEKKTRQVQLVRVKSAFN
jgi:hypothetical protein